ncbi:MAG TPA: hypothetical protein VD884_08335, partial [Ohtaekwangia sp.]|nr:hypothetical protein [Ohtaekwangia sp.]
VDCHNDVLSNVSRWTFIEFKTPADLIRSTTLSRVDVKPRKDHYEKQGFEIKEKSTTYNFVIWTANGNKANTIFLYGAKDKYAYNLAIFTDNWKEEKRIEFLKNFLKKIKKMGGNSK